VAIPLIVTPARTGSMELLALALFANAEDENDIGACTLAHSLIVSHLLDIRAHPRYARAGPQDYFVGLEVSNASSSAVKIDEIQTFSSYWTSLVSVDPTTSLLPNQSLRMQRRVQGTASTDLSQIDLVNSLSKLVQGQTDVSQDPSPGTTSLQGDISADDFAAYVASRQSFRVAQLQSCFPTIPLPTLAHIAPLLDPLDLDVGVSWSFDTTPIRHGKTFTHGIRVAPEFSVVEKIRREIDEAISKGGKTTRTMYEETGRLRQVLMDSVLDGSLSQEDDPVELRVTTREGKKRAEVDIEKGTLPICFSLKNRSPALAVRWVLDLPPPGGETTFGGMSRLRGTLGAGASEDAQTVIRIDELGMKRITGWVLRVETGDGDGKEGGSEDEQQNWLPRRSWSRGDAGEWVEVVAASAA